MLSYTVHRSNPCEGGLGLNCWIGVASCGGFGAVKFERNIILCCFSELSISKTRQDIPFWGTLCWRKETDASDADFQCNV